MIEVILLSASATLNILLGLTVFIKNTKSLTNKFFLLLTSSFAIWSIANYLSLHPLHFDQIFWVRIVIFCAALLCLSVYLTFTIFPSNHMVGRKRLHQAAVIYTILVMILSLTPYMFIVGENGQPTATPLVAFFAFLVVSLLGGGTFNLIRKYLHSDRGVKNQLKFVLIGLAGSFSLIVFTNFLIVVIFNYTNLLAFGPTFTLIFTGSLAYAIVRHKLFDIRAAVARGLAYVLSLGFLVATYATLSSIVIETLFRDTMNSTFTLGINAVFFMVAVLIYPTIKSFFDRNTNRIFFRDAYNSEVFLDELNAILVTTIDLAELLRGSASVINRNIKAEYCTFALKGISSAPTRFFGSKEDFTQADIDLIRKSSGLMRRKIIVTSELGEEYHELTHALQEKSIAVLAGMVTHSEKIGYLMLGEKKSGNIYSKQDIRIIDLIVDELALATQNSLRFEEIQKFASTLQDKVTDATKELRKTNEKLKALDEAKDEFISMASHQLRTPLTSAKGYVSMVLEGDTGPIKKSQRELLEQAYNSSQRMVYLIADLLNVSRLRTGKFVIENKETYLPDVVEGEIIQLQQTAANRKINLTFEKPKQFPKLMLDETKIRQVIMNFMDNAIYYTPAGGSVTVKLEATSDTVSYKVIDTGVGVPKSERHHLFNKFYRAGNAKKMRPDGTGLGLFMAKKVIVAQGGAIIFETEEGIGSTFGFSFPRTKRELKSK